MNTVAEKKKKSIHFTYEDRLILEYYLQGKNHFPKITNTQKLAEIFHKSRRTIQREIKRGRQRLQLGLRHRAPRQPTRRVR